MWKAVVLAASLAGLAAAGAARADDALDAIAKKDVLGSADIEALAAVVRNWRPKDRFEAAPKLPSLKGKRFSVRLPLRMYDEPCPGMPEIVYSRERGDVRAGYTARIIPLRDLRMLEPWHDPGRWLGRARWRTTMLYYRAISCRHEVVVDGWADRLLTLLRLRAPRHRLVITALAMEREDLPGTYNLLGEGNYPDREVEEPSFLVGLGGEAARKMATGAFAIDVYGQLDDWSVGEPVRCARRSPQVESARARADGARAVFAARAYVIDPHLDLMICAVRAELWKAWLVDLESGERLFEHDVYLFFPESGVQTR